MDVNAKVKVNRKTPIGDGQTTLVFGVDYSDDRNKEWAKFTPILNLSLVVLDSVAGNFEVGQPFTLTFTPEGTTP